VNQLLDLRIITAEVLAPVLAARHESWAIGPTFTGSALMNADADFIAAGMLVELKTEIGRKTGGSRRRRQDTPQLRRNPNHHPRLGKEIRGPRRNNHLHQRAASASVLRDHRLTQ
jgi:hypothetical protein